MFKLYITILFQFNIMDNLLSKDQNLKNRPQVDQQQSVVLPHNVDAEKAVLGAILKEPDSLSLIENLLLPQHFFIDIHKKIYTAINELSKQNEVPDIISVADKLKYLEHSSSENYVGAAYLVELTESSPLTHNVEYYAKIVRTEFYRREIIKSCQQTIQKAMFFDGLIEGFIEDIEKQFLKIANEYDRSGIYTLPQVLESTIEEIELRLNKQNVGIKTGFIDLDNFLGGFQKGDLIIVAARPGMGKTAFALNCAANIAKSGKNVVIFTLEMRKEELMMRVLAAEAKVDSSRLRRGELSEDEEDRLTEGARQIHKISAALGIDETPAITMMEIRSRCRRFKKQYGLDFVIIDYLQLIGSSSVNKTDTRERIISEISMGLKALAKELNIPIMALAQLNRAPDYRTDKKPKLSDLRESGSIEQDADLILFLYRDEYYNPTSVLTGVSEVIIGKNRHGPISTIKLAFQPIYASFQNLYKE